MQVKLNSVLCAVLALGAFALSASAQKIEYLEPKPLTQVVKATLRPVAGGATDFRLITWGGDVATIVAHMETIFKQEGIDATISCQNDFAQQVQDVIDGKTPYLRGTLGMINAAVEAFKQAGVELVVIYQETWSAGGDTIVVRDYIKSPKDLRGKTIALQLYGPHIDYVAKILRDAGIGLNEVKFKWLRELTLPTTDTGGRIVDPVSAFRADPSIDAVMCISPDAATLTSGDKKIGTGSEGSVKGAHILLTSKTASRIIADVYAVRKDYFDKNRDKVEKATHALMRGEESLRDLLKNKGTEQARYRQLLGEAANLLFGASQATADVEGLLGDCEFVGFQGNVGFFTGEGTTRTLQNLTDEIQSSFIEMGFLSVRVPVYSAKWDYQQLAKGLKYATGAVATKQVDMAKLQAKAENPEADIPELFNREIRFGLNQEDFTLEEYGNDFDDAIKLIQTYEGAVVYVEGYTDPWNVRKMEKDGEHPTVISGTMQKLKDKSLKRAERAKVRLLERAAKGNYTITNPIVVLGRGIEGVPKPNPKDREEQAKNRIVRITIRTVDLEADMPEGGK